MSPRRHPPVRAWSISYPRPPRNSPRSLVSLVSDATESPLNDHRLCRDPTTRSRDSRNPYLADTANPQLCRRALSDSDRPDRLVAASDVSHLALKPATRMQGLVSATSRIRHRPRPA